MLPIEFNSHKFSFVWYVFVEIFGGFLGMTSHDPKMTPVAGCRLWRNKVHNVGGQPRNSSRDTPYLLN